ncbi:PAS domain S-box protein [candidate division WOR-3 bacterium]|nr:PAS domain S-box protein [candidate division WOR-3 bacterium]
MGTIFENAPGSDWANKSKKELIETINELQHTLDELKELSTQQQNTEQALQQEIDFTMKLIHSAPTFFLTLTPEGSTLMMNDTMLHTLGYTTSDVVGHDCVELLIAPEDARIATEGLSLLTTEKTPHTFTVQVLSKKGKRHLVEWHCTPVLDLNNTLEYIFGIGIDITERQVAAQALSESVGRYHDLFENSPDSITLVTMDGRISNCNHATEELIGYTKDEIAGKHFNELLTIDSSLIDDLMEKHKHLKHGDTIPVYELPIIRKDGTHRTIEVSTSLLQQDKTITGIQIISRDITDRKEYEHRLRESEQKYRSLIEHSLQGILIVQNRLIVFANNAFARICGYSLDELLAFTPEQVRDLVHPDYQSLVWGRLQARLAGENVPEQYEFLGVHKDGTHRWLEMFAHVVDFKDSPAVQGVLIDITKRKQAALIRIQAEEKFRSIFDCANDAIFIHDMDGKFLEVNKTACDRLGYSKEELLAMGHTDIHSADFKQFLPQRIKELEQEGQMFFETAHLSKNGTETSVELSSRIIQFAGKPAILSVARDITERKRMQQSLLESERKYRSLVDNALVGIYKSSLDGKILYANDALAAMFEFDSPSDMVRHGILTLYKNEGDRARFLDVIQQSGLVKYFELGLQTKHHRPLHVMVSAHIEGDIVSGMIMDITDRKRMEEELKSNVDKLKQLMQNTVDSMATILETRDPYTAGHQQRVAQLANAIARSLNLSEDQLLGLNMAAVIHDIGKIYVPAEILTRPSTLTDSEFALIKTHPKVGYEILKRVEFPWPVATIVLQHHERINGSGYPQGLKGKSIILEARILAVADVVEAMSSHRPYRPAKTMEETLTEIETNKDVLYDTLAVETCLKLFRTRSFSFNKE